MRATVLRAALAVALFGAVPAQAGGSQSFFDVAAGNVQQWAAAIQRATTQAADDVTTIRLGPGDHVVDPLWFNPPRPPGAGLIVPRGTLRIEGTNGQPARLLLNPGSTGLEGPLLLIEPPAGVEMSNLRIEGFTTTTDGAVARVQGGRLTILNSTVANNRANRNGGAIQVTGGRLTVIGSTFSGNSAGNLGGAISSGQANDTFVQAVYNRFLNNTAGVFGCDVNVDKASNDGYRHRFVSNIFSELLSAPRCNNVRVENPSGGLFWFFNAANVEATARILDSTSSGNRLLGNYWAFTGALAAPRAAPAKTLCADFGSGSLQSLGANIATDGSCAPTGPGDLVTASPGLTAPDASGLMTTTAGSPAIDRGPATIQAIATGGATRRLLPCGYRDVRGLGRPQDANLDGTFQCDTGAYETQGGPNVGNAVSGAYYDTARNGEGTFIENLGGGLAFVATFTYGPTGGLAWFVGIGRIVGNSVVVDEVLNPTGGVFGAGFNPAAIRRARVGGASFVFPTCAADAQPGQWAFEGALDSGYEDLLARATRLTSVVPCSGAASANAGRSGSFYSAARDGEGIFVQFLPDGRPIVIWYTFDPQGRQFWTISADATVNGNTVTANMVYPAQTTRFGSQFNPGQVQLAPWGTVTLNYTNCNAMTFAYNSSVAGFGAGQYNYTRLTSLAGTTCN